MSLAERKKQEKEIKEEACAQAEQINLEEACAVLRQRCPKVHCLSNPVSMQDTANLLLAIGGSAIMAQAAEEAAEITSITDATLLNTGVPDEAKWEACRIAGQQANRLAHPLVLDPVGAGASRYRKESLLRLLHSLRLSLVRCNQEEAWALLTLLETNTALHEEKTGGALKAECGGAAACAKITGNAASFLTGGVESSLQLPEEKVSAVAKRLAKELSCTVFISGKTDVITDGARLCFCRGGDARIRRLTGSGCMLSALCAAFLGAGLSAFDAAAAAGQFWRGAARLAGVRTSQLNGGIGTFHQQLFDAAEWQIREGREWSENS